MWLNTWTLEPECTESNPIFIGYQLCDLGENYLASLCFHFLICKQINNRNYLMGLPRELKELIYVKPLE